MRYALLYWACFAVVAMTLLVQSVPQALAGEFGISTVVSLVAGLVILVASLLGLRAPERSGAPTEPGPILYVMILAALFSVGSLVLLL